MEVAPGEYAGRGRHEVDDLNDRLNSGAGFRGPRLHGGFMDRAVDCLPPMRAGESMEYEGIRMVVDVVDRNRIDKVRIYLPASENSSRLLKNACFLRQDMVESIVVTKKEMVPSLQIGW